MVKVSDFTIHSDTIAPGSTGTVTVTIDPSVDAPTQTGSAGMTNWALFTKDIEAGLPNAPIIGLIRVQGQLDISVPGESISFTGNDGGAYIERISLSTIRCSIYSRVEPYTSTPKVTFRITTLVDPFISI